MKMKVKFVIPALLSLAALQASAQGEPGGVAMWFAPPVPVADGGTPVAGMNWWSTGSIIAHQIRSDRTITWFFRSDLPALTLAK